MSNCLFICLVTIFLCPKSEKHYRSLYPALFIFVMFVCVSLHLYIYLKNTHLSIFLSIYILYLKSDYRTHFLFPEVFIFVMPVSLSKRYLSICLSILLCLNSDKRYRLLYSALLIFVMFECPSIYLSIYQISICISIHCPSVYLFVFIFFLPEA